MTNGQRLKAMPVWGSQNGLLSVAELDHLMHVLRSAPMRYVSLLEVGHYYGLSTCAMVSAMQEHVSRMWSITTIDAHCADAWVQATDPDVFFHNKRQYFDDHRVNVLIANSEGIERIDGYNVVFYDGDHADEQLRFTELAINSATVQLFIFDDRDFTVPRKCGAMLREAGWIDASPPLYRLDGGNDKRDPRTMTLGVFWRPNNADQ